MYLKGAVRNAGKKVGAGLALIVFGMGSALAELPTEVTAAFTAVKTDGASMIALGWPVVTAVVGGLLLIKLFKKVASRST